MKEKIKLLTALNSFLEDKIKAARAYNEAIKLAIHWTDMQRKKIDRTSMLVEK